MPEERTRDYSYLIKAFTKEKIEERSVFLYQVASDFLEAIYLNEYVRIEQWILREVVIDYFADIKRLKDFHRIEQARFRKIAAYTAFWVVKKKPLQYTGKTIPEDSDPFMTQLAMNVNEWFAYSLTYTMAFDRTQPILQEPVILARYREFSKFLHYYFTYRVITPQAIELALEALAVVPLYEPL